MERRRGPRTRIGRIMKSRGWSEVGPSIPSETLADLAQQRKDGSRALRTLQRRLDAERKKQPGERDEKLIATLARQCRRDSAVQGALRRTQENSRGRVAI